MVVDLGIEQAEVAANCTRAGFLRAIYQARNARVDHGSRAHGARFDGDVKSGTTEAIVGQCLCGLAQHNDLGMGRWVVGSDDDGDGIEDYASMPARDNDEIKFVVSYGVDFNL